MNIARNCGPVIPGIILASTGMVFAVPVANAQERITNTLNIDEIVVTTRKREENLQEVPIAINVLGAEQIAREGIRGLDQISKLSPSLQFERSFSQNSVRVTLRGLSNTRGRANVAFLVDGIDVTSEVTGNNAGSPLLINQRLLNDVERIEVVKGSQSALYGRAAFAGAINYVTKEPSDEFEANLALDIAEYGQQEVFAGTSIPLSDITGIRLTSVYWDSDGVYRNVVSGNKFGAGDGYGLAGTLVWEPADNFKVKSRISYTDENYTPAAVAENTAPRVALDVPEDAATVTDETSVDLIPLIGSAEGLEVRASEDPITGGEYPGNTLEVLRGSIIATWDIEDYTLSSYSGYTDADFSQRYDLDRQAEGRPDTILGHGEIDSFGNTTQVSQELRIATNWDDSPVNLTAGLQYWNEERDDFSRSISVTCRNTAFCGPDQNITKYESWQDLYADALANSLDYRNPIFAETDHWSIYLMAEWDISTNWSLTLEDRFVKEDFDALVEIGSSCVNAFGFNANLDLYNFITDENQPNCIHGTPQNGTTKSDYQTPKLTLEWQTRNNALLYGSIAKAVKPAGVSLVLVPIKFEFPIEGYTFAEEKMWSYEIGAKTSWDGTFGNLVFNSAVFYLDYTDKQTNTIQQIGNFLLGVPTNASAASVKGLEIETNWATPVEGLSVGAAATLLDSEYEDFVDATRSATPIAIAGTCGEVVIIRGTEHCNVDRSGNQLEFMPKRSYVVTGKYEVPLAATGLEWFVESNASYQSKRYTSADNFTQLDSFWKVDARIGLTGERWDIVAYVTNLFDDNTITSAGGNPDVAAGYVDTLGLTPPTLPTAFLPQPRTYGLRFQYQY